MDSEKKIVDFKKGEAGIDLSLKDGKVRLLFSYDGKGLDAGLYADLEPEYFVEKLKNLIPGEIDDMVLDLLLKALKK